MLLISWLDVALKGSQIIQIIITDFLQYNVMTKSVGLHQKSCPQRFPWKRQYFHELCWSIKQHSLLHTWIGALKPSDCITAAVLNSNTFRTRKCKKFIKRFTLSTVFTAVIYLSHLTAFSCIAKQANGFRQGIADILWSPSYTRGTCSFRKSLTWYISLLTKTRVNLQLTNLSPCTKETIKIIARKTKIRRDMIKAYYKKK